MFVGQSAEIRVSGERHTGVIRAIDKSTSKVRVHVNGAKNRTYTRRAGDLTLIAPGSAEPTRVVDTTGPVTTCSLEGGCG